MNKEKLNQYRALQKEIPGLKRDIQKLITALDNVPVVAGKVMKSSEEFPYTKQYVTVEMPEPKQKAALERQIAAKEKRLQQAVDDKAEIEEFVASISDSVARQIFELMYLGEKRMTQRKIGDILGYDQSSVSLKIKKNLNDS